MSFESNVSDDDDPPSEIPAAATPAAHDHELLDVIESEVILGQIKDGKVEKFHRIVFLENVLDFLDQELYDGSQGGEDIEG